MYGENGENVMYYLTVYNEPVHQPAEPENLDVEGLHRGIYQFNTVGNADLEANIVASGVGLHESLRAQKILDEDYGVKTNLFAVTSGVELARHGKRLDQEAWQHGVAPEQPFVTPQLESVDGPY